MVRKIQLIVFKDLILDASIDHNLSNFQSIASFSFVKSNDTQNILINKVDAKIEYTRNKNSKYQVSALLDFGKTELNGKIKGFINPFDLVFKISSASTSLQLIKYDKSIESCLTLKSTTNKRKLEGFANLDPNHLDLEFFKNDEYLKIASGDSLKFRVNITLLQQTPVSKHYSLFLQKIFLHLRRRQETMILLVKLKTT